MRQTQQGQGAVLRSPAKGSGAVHPETALPQPGRYLKIPRPSGTRSPPRSFCLPPRTSGLQLRYDVS
jgi:hypothetical protein